MNDLGHIRVPSYWTRLECNRPFSQRDNGWEPTAQTFADSRTTGTIHWNARSHRKGLIPKRTESTLPDCEKHPVEPSGWTTRRQSKVRLWGWDWQDISWWVAFFTLGSTWWCAQGILVFCYFTRTSQAYTNAESALAFLGGTTFLLGAYLGWVESLNPARDAEFAWVVEEETRTLIEPDKHGQSLGRKRRHFGRHKVLEDPAPLKRSPDSGTSCRRVISDSTESTSDGPTSSATATARKDPPPWRWYGTKRSIAYLANSVQLCGAVAFEISVISGLPGVLPETGTLGGPEQAGKSERLWIGLYWAMQVIGSPCFFVPGLLFCYEVQPNFWHIKPLRLGWQIGFWNFIGGLGFFFSGLFGIWRQTEYSDPETYQRWGTAFSTFWGSWAFLIGSYLQMLETLNKWE